MNHVTSTMTRLEAAVLIALAVLFAPATGTAQQLSPAELLSLAEAEEKRAEERYDRDLANGCQPINPSVAWVADEDQVDGGSLLRGGPLYDSAESLGQ